MPHFSQSQNPKLNSQRFIKSNHIQMST